MYSEKFFKYLLILVTLFSMDVAENKNGKLAGWTHNGSPSFDRRVLIAAFAKHAVLGAEVFAAVIRGHVVELRRTSSYNK